MTAAVTRACDADRDLVTQRLQAACAAGSLTARELEERLDKALRAVRVSDLEDLVRDLPGPEPVLARPRIASVARLAGIYALLSVTCVAVWLVAGAHGGFWPTWVLLAGAVRLAAYAWHQRGDGPGDTAPLWLLGPLRLALTHLPPAGRPRAQASAASHTAPGPTSPTCHDPARSLRDDGDAADRPRMGTTVPQETDCHDPERTSSP